MNRYEYTTRVNHVSPAQSAMLSGVISNLCEQHLQSKRRTALTVPPRSGNALGAFVAHFERHRHAKSMAVVGRRNPVEIDYGKPIPEEKRAYIERAIEDNKAIVERLNRGYVHLGAAWWDGAYNRAPFVEPGLRSTESDVLKLFVANLPRGKKMFGGRNKGDWIQFRRKLFFCDQPSIKARPGTMICIDLDRTFESMEHLKSEIRKLRRPSDTWLPHIAVGSKTPDGKIVRPHIWILLAPGSAVWMDRSDARCREAPIRLLEAVARGIVDAFLPLGADPRALTDMVRGKNPLSPLWHTEVLNDAEFPSLTEMARAFGTGRPLAEQVRDAAERDSQLGAKGSNMLFVDLQRMSYDKFREWHLGGDPEYFARLHDRALLGEYLIASMTKAAIKSFATSPKQVLAVFYKVAQFAARAWDPSRARRMTTGRGSARGMIDPDMSLADRQRVGAAYTAKTMVSRSVQRIADAIIEIEDKGEKLTKTEIARVSGLHRETVATHYAEGLRHAADCRIRSIDKRLSTTLEETEERGGCEREEHEWVEAPDDNEMEFIGWGETTRQRAGESKPKSRTLAKPSFLCRNRGDRETERPQPLITYINYSKPQKETGNDDIYALPPAPPITRH